MNLRIDGRHTRAIIAHNNDGSGMLGLANRTAPAGAQTPNGSLTEPMEGSAMTDSNRQQLAGEFLDRARADFEQAALTRLRYVFLARKYGMTNSAIGDRLGISEGAVRALVKRYDGMV